MPTKITLFTLLFLVLSMPVSTDAKDTEDKPISSYSMNLQSSQSIDRAEGLPQANIERAERLADWTAKTLKKSKPSIAILGRQGSPQYKAYDSTGSVHGAIAFFNPMMDDWDVFSLIRTSEKPSADGSLEAAVHLDSLYSFYLTQFESEEALILLPSEKVDKALYSYFLNQIYYKHPLTSQYNLASPYDDLSSQNCNEWILQKIIGALHPKWNNEEILNSIKANFKPKMIDLTKVEASLLSNESEVNSKELFAYGKMEIGVVTVESLMNTKEYFPKSIFYSGKQ